MATGEIKLTGFDVLDRKLHELPTKVGKKILKDSLKVGAEVIQKEAERQVRAKAKVRGRKAISLSAKQLPPSSAKAEIGITPKKWYLKFLELGTVIHEVVAGSKGGGRGRTAHPTGKQILAEASKNIFFGKKIVTMIEPKPFLRPAFDTRKEDAIDAMGKDLGAKIEIEARKR